MVRVAEPIPLRVEPVPGDAERAARRDLRDQVARLERQLAADFVHVFPRAGLDPDGAPPPGRIHTPRLLSLGELEELRDALHRRLADLRRLAAARAEREARSRALLERMLLEPGRHRFVRVTSADLGEGGCGVWHVRPRLGLVGMLCGWWQVKLSSGCPLATGRRPARAARPSAERWASAAASARFRCPSCAGSSRPRRRSASRPAR